MDDNNHDWRVKVHAHFSIPLYRTLIVRARTDDEAREFAEQVVAKYPEESNWSIRETYYKEIKGISVGEVKRLDLKEE